MQERDANGKEPLTSFALPIENELLMMTLQAEFGARCIVGDEQVHPKAVNEFLKSVYAFEKKLREDPNPVRIGFRLGEPVFPETDSLSKQELRNQIKAISRQLSDEHIQLDIFGDYPEEQIYKFLTTEFMNVEVEVPEVDGFVQRFCYEDFHPNHEMDISQRSLEFITRWLAKETNDSGWELAEFFVGQDGRVIGKGLVVQQILAVFDAFERFEPVGFQQEEVAYVWDEQKEQGRGFSKGWIRYRAHIDAEDLIDYDGKYEFYLSCRDGWWSIDYFVFPGFSWKDQ